MSRFSPLRSAAIAAAFLCAAAAANQNRTITNPLGMDFPWDIVSMDFPAGTFTGDTKASLAGEERPVQVEQVEVDGKKIDRAWFFATLGAKEKSVDVTFSSGKAVSPLKLSRDDRHLVIDNGISRTRIVDYAKVEVAGKKLSEIPHWLGGVRVGEGSWDGRAWFEGSAVLSGAKTTIVNEGPVFIDVRVEYAFQANHTDGTTLAQPPELGKQTFRRAPGELPRETIEKKSHHYEVLIRVAANDPWAEIVERYRLPKDESVPSFGVHQYMLHFGQPTEKMPNGGVPAGDSFKVDTAMWTRWFEWDAFGGNSQLGFVEARARPAQKGRPFAILRSRWNQGGGGAQDFFLTAGGKEADASLPAAGVIAAYPSKWVGPYAATLFAYAYDGNRGQIRIPLTDGDGGDEDSKQDPLWYGSRAYALCVGPRGLFDSTNKMDSLVRRHTDWTLNAQVNKYIFEWERDPSVAGANIVTSRKRLEQLRKELEQNADTSSVRLLKAARDKHAVEREKLAALDPKSEEAKELSKKLNASAEARLISLIEGRNVGRPGMPNPDQYLGRRYQADDVNPTNYGTRRLINGLFPDADLYSVGQPFGNGRIASIGYIFTDLDAWPGWRNGWGPGNPNFHTDKYIGALFTAAAMSDHPHAKEWFAFGKAQFDDDVNRVVTAPHGVGYECPGYSGYSLGLQTELARVFYNAGTSNPIAENPLFKASTIWHRKLLTPFDKRLGRRHEAPHGDTHRWDSGIGKENWAKLAVFYRESDPKHASELMGVFRLLAGESWKPKSLQAAVFEMDLDVPVTPVEQLDWSSQYFHGFGAVMRSAFGTDRESFLSIKAGWTRGHYHNDDLAFHYYNHTTPIALDYNCSYHPRGDHAALHNSMTFGREAKIRHNARGENVDATEQLSSSGRVGAFVSAPAADVIVAERSGSSLTMSPIDPEDAEFSRQYDSRTVDQIVHRRLLAMVKHAPGSPLSDYLVVRDETRSTEPQQINLHVLARDAKVDADVIKMAGQWDQDMLVRVVESTDLKVDTRYWAYFDEWTGLPSDIVARADESDADWAKRVAPLFSAWKPKTVEREGLGDNTKAWHKAIAETKGRAMMPPPGWDKPWLYGEAQVWLRMSTKPGTPTTWVLYPYKRGTPAPAITRLDDGRVSVKVGGVEEMIRIGSESGVTVTQDGTETVLIPPNALPGLGQIKQELPTLNEVRQK